jgi:addiction module RelB/DinJ family antitoxin
MALVTKTATIQVRVVPVVKAASERVLWRIGLNMSEAIELFLRRIIVDERIPFEVIALELAQIDSLSTATLRGEKVGTAAESGGGERRHRSRSNTRAPKKEFTNFFGGRTPGKIQAPKGRKNLAH